MRKSKTVKEFSFLNLSKQDMVNFLNTEAPINIKTLEPLINRIYEKYPVIDKSKIAIIVKTVFEVMREFLVLGYVMNFNKLVFDWKLFFFQFNKINLGLKAKLKTPQKLKQG